MSTATTTTRFEAAPASALLPAAALGFAAGLRTMTPLAVAAWRGRRSSQRRPSPLSWLAAPVSAPVLMLMAAGELVLDKLPSTPSRLAPGPLAGRLVSGALSAAFASRRAAALPAAAAGAAGALAGAFVGYHWRRYLVRRVGFADSLVAGVEDAVAVTVAAAAVESLGSQS